METTHAIINPKTTRPSSLTNINKREKEEINIHINHYFDIYNMFDKRYSNLVFYKSVLQNF
jgi:hypothetical protein